jgi:16S rRNA (cytidine1402-2'-O)-methyltransferase
VTAGSLYLIPSALAPVAADATLPIPHLEIVRGLRHFVVETAKTARAELKRLGHPVPLSQLHIEEMPRQWTPERARQLLAPVAAGESAGVLSDAGCPGVADPGADLVRQAHLLGIPVVPLIGPSSLLLALMGSGLNGQRFCFHGYLPVKDEALHAEIARLEQASARQRMTQIFIETPYRNGRLFAALTENCRGETLLCIASGLTGAGQSITTRSIRDWKAVGAPDFERVPTVFLMLAG